MTLGRGGGRLHRIRNKHGYAMDTLILAAFSSDGLRLASMFIISHKYV